MPRILVINPGSTSTKTAVYDDIEPLFEGSMSHSPDQLSAYANILEQFDFRKQVILEQLAEQQIALTSLHAVVGRGGLVHPLEGGCYAVNEAMLRDLQAPAMGEHASNLGALLAHAIGAECGVPAYIVDPVVVDELEPLARYSGLPHLPRQSIFHALNQKAVARRVARELGESYENINVIVAHLGGGISVGAHKRGRVVDVNNALNGDGPFSPERSGGLPVGQLVTLCFSGRQTEKEIKKLIKGRGGLLAYLQTTDGQEIQTRIAQGDTLAAEVYEAMAYQIAKEIGGLAAVLRGEVDAIILTGGLAHSTRLTDWITERVRFLAPVHCVPGENEMLALVEGVLPVLRGTQAAKTYIGSVSH